MSKIIIATYVAYNWEEYESQGPQYKELAMWWRNNASRLSGEYSQDYDSWTRWYRQKYNEEWNRQHVGPAEALQILEKEVSGESSSLGQRIKERTIRLFDRNNHGGLSNSPQGGSSNYKGVISINIGADVENTSNKVKEFLTTLGNLAKQRRMPTPHVTSGYRSSRAQARAMAKNWMKYGGNKVVSDAEARTKSKRQGTIDSIKSMTNEPINLGLIYLFELYADNKTIININQIFMQLGAKFGGQKAVAEYLDSSGNSPSPHMKTPGQAVDLKITKGIDDLLQEIKNSGQFNMKTIYENDHYHVQVYS